MELEIWGKAAENFDERLASKLVNEKKILKRYYGLLNDLAEVVLWVKERIWLELVIHHLTRPREVKKVFSITKVA